MEEFGMSESNKVIRLCDMCICVVDKLCLTIEVARYRRAGCLPCVSAHCDLACPPLQAPHPVNPIQPLSHHHTSCLCFSFVWSNDATQPQTLKHHLSGHVGLMRGLWIVCWWLYVCWSCCGWGLCGQSIGYCCRGEMHKQLAQRASMDKLSFTWHTNKAHACHEEQGRTQCSSRSSSSSSSESST